ncbi:hypothetical protein [Curtobacterium herbarum]|uniref:Bacterial Ig domain-containing protein n=1 Tax=Curtobacterium herbarum TaxID=150122 RepID=A0ABN1ZFR7_9MICO|nr:hypothetical protein [Curtobacterium herbarum]MBM7476578.1 hypothetical protein [Curtobacterium herbarum]MCS6543860.1 hypothetical protein [Curtobacterium herbarum]
MHIRPTLAGATALVAAITAGVTIASTADAAPGSTPGAAAASAAAPSAAAARSAAPHGIIPEYPDLPGSWTRLSTVNGEWETDYGQAYPLWVVADDDDDIDDDVPIDLSVRSSHDGTLTVVGHGDPYDPTDDSVVLEAPVESGTSDVSFAVPDSNWDYTMYVVTADDQRTSPERFTLAVGGQDVQDLAGTYSDVAGSTDERITVTGSTYANERVEIVTRGGGRYSTRSREDGRFGITYFGSTEWTEVVVEHNGWTNRVQEVPFEQVEPGEGDPSLVWPIVDLGDLRSLFGLFVGGAPGRENAYLTSASGAGLGWRLGPEDVAGNNAVGWSIPNVDVSGPIILEGNTCVTAGADGALRSATCIRDEDGDPSQTFTAVLRDGDTLLRLASDESRYLTLGADGRVVLGDEADAAVLAYVDLYESSWSVAEPAPSVVDRSVRLSGTAIPGALVTVDGVPVENGTGTDTGGAKGARAVTAGGSWSTTLHDLPVRQDRTFEVQQLIDGVVVARSEQTVRLDAGNLSDVTSAFRDDVTLPAQITGAAEPGATIQLLDGGVPVEGATTTAASDGDARGSFALDVPAPNAAGAHEFAVVQVLGGAAVGAPSQVTIDYGAGVSIVDVTAP